MCRVSATYGVSFSSVPLQSRYASTQVMGISDVRVNDDAIRVHRSRGGMNFSLLADHHSALMPSAMRSASSSVRPLRCATSSNRSQSKMR